MKKFFSRTWLLLAALIIVGCGPKSSMDEETENALIEQYGEPMVVDVSNPGKLIGQLDGKREDELRFIRIFGKIGAEDIKYLNSFENNFSVQVLDLLDATIVAGDSVYFKDYEEKDYRITEDNQLGGYSFDGLFHLEKVYLPQNLTKIEADAFRGKSNLDYVSIPQSVKLIGESAFNGCSSLTSIILPDGLESIGYNAFYGSIKSIRIPKSVNSLDERGIGEFEDIYMEWNAEEVANFKDVSLSWIKFETEGRKSIMTFMYPTLHVPANFVDAYKESFKSGCKVVADETVTDDNVESEPQTDKPASLNASLLGRWSNNNDPVIDMVLADKKGKYDDIEGMGYVRAANEYFEYDFTLVFTSITPDGENIKVHYNKMESQFDGNPEDEDGGGEWKEVKIGEGDLTLIPQGEGKVKIESTEQRIKNAVLYK